MTEKVWAKLNGNYEATVSGSPTEFFSFFAGIPSDLLYTDSSDDLNNDADTLYDVVSEAIDE